MTFSSEQATRILDQSRKIIDSDESSTMRAAQLWHCLLYVKACNIAAVISNTIGSHVYSGPFKGMALTPAVMTRAFAPILLGTYEHELHAAVEAIVATPYRTILNIGCGFGYYTVGLARRMPQAVVLGFDTNEAEQKRTQDMAALNNVQDRVTTGGLFDGARFADYAGQKTLVIMDIEGGEESLLDPQRYPALRTMDILVELHDVLINGLSKTVPQRFAATHDIEIIYNRPSLFDFSPLVGPDTYVDPSHSMAAVWEHREGATPWALMRVKSI